ncbi:MAG: twin-arginine translocase subunit TatC [Proteobacteria bacterium]|nr:twin-arginine translocase subunit TatC [Pseudomonadota bacterium]
MRPQLPEDDVQMGVFEHLGELRMRLIRAMLGVVPSAGIAWFFKERLLEILIDPLRAAWLRLGLGEPTIHFANVIDPLVAYLKIAVVVGLLIASPWVFWQLWAFVSPGLYLREKRLAAPFVAASTVCFGGGAFFGYLVVFPMGFETFLGFAGMLPSQGVRIQPTIMITEYLTFSTRMLLAFGVVFEIPVVVSFLALAHIVNWRQLLHFGRWWVVLSAVLSALLTPPDVGSQLLMIAPLNLLYFGSVGLAYLLGPKPPKRTGTR